MRPEPYFIQHADCALCGPVEDVARTLGAYERGMAVFRAELRIAELKASSAAYRHDSQG